MRMPFGRVQDSVTVPTGSCSAATASIAAAIASTRPGIERQAVEKGAGHAGGARFGDILGIGGQNAGSLRPDGGGHALQRAVLLRGRGERQHPGGGAAAPADFAHRGGDIARSLDAFERRAHAERPVQPRFGLVPITSGRWRRDRRHLAATRSCAACYLGIAWITATAGTGQLTYTLDWQGAACR